MKVSPGPRERGDTPLTPPPLTPPRPRLCCAALGHGPAAGLKIGTLLRLNDTKATARTDIPPREGGLACGLGGAPGLPLPPWGALACRAWGALAAPA